MRRLISRSVVAAFAVAILLFAVPNSFALNRDGGKDGRCSLATLKGSFGFLDQITYLVGPPPPPWPLVSSGLATYDGAGKVSGKFTLNANGVVVSGTATGTYTVNPDCTYSDEVTDNFGNVTHRLGTITGGEIFKGIDYIFTDAFWVGSGRARKTPLGGCSVAALKGSYEKLEHSTVVVQLPGFSPTPFPTATSVIVTYDGAGSDSGAFTVNFDGAVFSGTGTAKYTVNSDCTYSEQITLSDGSIHNTVGTIVGSEVFPEVQFIYTDNWLVSSGTIRKSYR
jgi:hypothetical protein